MFDDRDGESGHGVAEAVEPWGQLSVGPSEELLAFWDQVDAQYGEPDDPAGVAYVPDGEAGDFALVEQVASFERLISWARARQLATVAALAGRPSMNPVWPVRVGQPNITAEEIAARLGSSRALGRELVEAARLFAGPLWATADALQAGEIDWGKARIVIAALRRAPGPVAVDVQQKVLPEAGQRTHGQLRIDLERALVAVDPLDAELRAVRAVDERRVCHPKVLPDGMAGIWAVLPAAVAAAIDAALNRAARAAKGAGDPRTSDQLRADTLTGTLLPGGAAQETAATCPGAGSRRPNVSGSGAAFGLAPGVPGISGMPAVPGISGVPNTPGVPARALGGAGVLINVTVALTTLLGLDESPGELAGYGAITAQTARRLALAGRWRRLVTDPLTGTVLDVGRRRYHPPDDLAELVRARDQHCLSPVCMADARWCDLDHREPFRLDGTGGATSAENLGPLCRRDHLLKTHARWRLDKDDGGTFTWTTPTGHTYRYRSQPPPGHDPAWDQPPPF